MVLESIKLLVIVVVVAAAVIVITAPFVLASFFFVTNGEALRGSPVTRGVALC